MYKLLLPALCAVAAQAARSKLFPAQHQLLVPQELVGAPTPTIQSATFTQLLNHSDPHSPTFEQTYWYDAQYYKGPGSPILVFAPNEANGTFFTSLITNSSIVGQLAQMVGGASILMEHRYWGNSSPFSELTTANLQYLTLENSIGDVNYFAQNVKLPFAKSGYSPTEAPWVLMGGSYGGALTTWTQAKAPGTYWAYYATSAVVETISDFWQFFKQIELGMPKNCSSDVTQVISHMDNILTTGTAQEITELKTMFGLQSVEHNDDFMAVLLNGPYYWQDPSFFSGGDVEYFYQWCDYVENATNGTVPGAEGVGLTKALQGYATWVKDVLLPDFCVYNYGSYFANDGEYGTSCFNTYDANSPIYTDTSLSNLGDRQWTFYLCNQPFGWWYSGLPAGQPTIASRLITPEYYTRQCGLYFPKGPQGQSYGIAEGKTEQETNAYTGGWNIDKTTRLVYTNGQYDPWMDATVSSQYRPGGPLKSTKQVPVFVVPEGNHCSDLITANGQANAGVLAVQKKELAQLKKWINQFRKPTHYSH